MKNQKEPPGELRQSNLWDVLGKLKLKLPSEITRPLMIFLRLQKKNFNQTTEFILQHWIPQEPPEYWVHMAHLVVPFGSWKRIRPGKRISEQEIHVITAIMIRISCFANLFPLQIFFQEQKGTPRSALWIQYSEHSSGIQIEIFFWDYLTFNIFFSFYRRKISPRLQNLYPNVGFPRNVQKIGFTRLTWLFLLVLEKGFVQEKG